MLFKAGITFRIKYLLQFCLVIYNADFCNEHFSEKLLHPIPIISLKQILRTRIIRSKVMLFKAFVK